MARFHALVIPFAALVVLAACGDDGETTASAGSGGDAATGTSSATASSSSSTSPSGTGGDEEGDGGQDATTSSSGVGGSGGEGGGMPVCPGFGDGQLEALVPGAGLVADDVEALTDHLDVLANGWDDDAVPAANDILVDPTYDADDLRAFFDAYFVDARRPLTDDLWNYLGYPTFSWFDDPENERLQRALNRSLRRRVEVELAEHAGDLGAALDADVGLRKTLFHAGRILAFLARDGVLDEGERRDAFDWCARMAAEHPHAWLHGSPVDVVAEPWVAPLRAQLAMGFVDLVPLDDCDAEGVADRLDITGAHRAIWDAHRVLVHDNHAFSPGQLGFIDGALEVVPASLHDLGHITQIDLLGNSPPGNEPLRGYRSVNIFDTPIGTVPENQFPPDIEPGEADIFVSALVHEISHMVDFQHVSLDAALLARKEALLERAGLVDLEYLRSQIGGAFFQDAPVELFASISNQYLTDSRRTLALALQRFDAGYREPLHQVLFFADVISSGGDGTRFYAAPFGAEAITFDDVGMQRDGEGRITSLTVDGTTYGLTLDDDGLVTAYSVD